MTEPTAEDGTLANHLSHLAATADDVIGFLNQAHDDAEIKPAALAKSEHLATSLREVVDALRHHDHLAMTSDDVWKSLTMKHQAAEDGTLT